MDAFNTMSFSKESAELTREALTAYIKSLDNKMGRQTNHDKWFELYEKSQELKYIRTWFDDMLANF